MVNLNSEVDFISIVFSNEKENDKKGKKKGGEEEEKQQKTANRNDNHNNSNNYMSQFNTSSILRFTAHFEIVLVSCLVYPVVWLTVGAPL